MGNSVQHSRRRLKVSRIEVKPDLRGDYNMGKENSRVFPITRRIYNSGMESQGQFSPI